jgi:hypothetical protein
MDLEDPRNLASRGESVSSVIARAPIRSYISYVRIVVGGKESISTTCPQVNGCIAAQVPRLPGYTQAELDAMPENERKQILSKLAEPPVPYNKPT